MNSFLNLQENGSFFLLLQVDSLAYKFIILNDIF